MSFLSVRVNPLAVLHSDFLPVQYLPKWFPGASFHQRAEIYSKVLRDLVDIPFEIVKSRLVSFLSRYI